MGKKSKKKKKVNNFNFWDSIETEGHVVHSSLTISPEALKMFKTDMASARESAKNEINQAVQDCIALGYSDAMILNMANHASIEHIVTLDFDLVYSGDMSSTDKMILTPTSRLKSFKNILKK